MVGLLDMRLADLLTREQPAIVERWLERVRPLAPRPDLSRVDLLDSLPAFLGELERALRRLDDPALAASLPERSPVAVEHGQQRHRLGYATENVAREYPLLHEVLLAMAAAAAVAVSTRESILLARAMGTATAEALTAFSSAGEHQSQASRDAQARRIQAAEQHARESEAALRASEERYRTLFESLDQGFCLVELLQDGRGVWVDYRFLAVNAAFAAQTGLHRALGRRMRELVPDLDPSWPARLGRVVDTGIPARFEEPTMAMGRWFSVFGTRVGPPELCQVAVLFTDVTARKRREAHLALLAELAEDFARLVSADDILQAVGHKLGAHLALSNLNLADVDDPRGLVTINYSWARAGTTSLVRTYRLAEYLSEEFCRESRAGETVVVRDTQRDPRADAAAYAALGIGSFVTVPFHVAGAWKAWVTVVDTAPRAWRDDELELVQEISSRLFPRLERARAEVALRRSEERYRTLFEAMYEGFCVVEVLFDAAQRPVDYRYVEVNPVFEQKTGMRGVLGKTLRELVPDAEPPWVEIYGKVALTGEPARFEDRAAMGGRWFDVHAFRTGAPAEHKVAVLFDDITERKQAEALALAEQEKLHAIFAQAPVLIAIAEGPDYIFTFVNPAYRVLLGVDVVGKSAREVLPEFEVILRALVDEVLATGVPFVGREVPIRMPQSGPGEYTYFDFVYQPWRDDEGRVKGVLACGYDVSLQVRARQEAQRLAAQLEAILQSFPEPLFVADAQGAIRANAAGLRLMGAASVEELNRALPALQDRVRLRRADTGELMGPADNLLVRALAGHTGFLDTIMRDPLTGEDRLMRSAGAPVRIGAEVVGAVAFSTDITERLAAEQALRERADFEEKLIGIVGHDLRQPLQTIAMSAGLLLRRPGLDERALVGVQRITAASARMQRMLRDILDFTRARLGGGIPVEPAPSDLAVLAREAAEELELVHAGRKILLDVAGDAGGSWDADRLRQVLDNLLTNALVYSPAGSEVALEVDGRAPDAVRVRIHNAGAPIPAALLPVLFQPLTRGAGLGGAERSVGLGLFIVRHLVEAHGGRVEVDSSEAAGTTFLLHLPRAQPQGAAGRENGPRVGDPGAGC